MDELIAFLLGEAPLEGVWFDGRHPLHKGRYWWRTKLRAAWNRRAMPANPVARVTGYFDGHCVVASLNTAALLPVGMALFANAAPQAPVIDRDAVIEEVATWYAETGWKMDEDDVADGIRALKQSPAMDDGMAVNALAQGREHSERPAGATG